MSLHATYVLLSFNGSYTICLIFLFHSLYPIYTLYIRHDNTFTSPQHFKDEGFQLPAVTPQGLFLAGRPTCFHIENSKVIQFMGLAPTLYLVSLDSPSRSSHISHRYIVALWTLTTCLFQALFSSLGRSLMEGPHTPTYICSHVS